MTATVGPNHTRFLAIFVIASSAAAAAVAQSPLIGPPPDQILNTLKPGYRRLLLDAVAFARVRHLVRTDPLPTSPDPDIQATKRGTRKLAIHLADVKRTRIAVQFSPEWPRSNAGSKRFQ